MKRSVRIAISLACGVLAGLVAYGYAEDVQAQAAQEREELLARFGDEMTQVCVATRDIDRRELLDETNVAVEEWVAGLVPEQAPTSLNDVVGQQATSNIPARAVLSPVYLERADSALEVPNGMVAVSVAVDEEHAVGGAVSPGDNVDVYVAQDGLANRLCSAQVIDTSVQTAETTGDAIAWATLAVAPERVPELLAATAKGAVSLALPALGSTGATEGGA